MRDNNLYNDFCSNYDNYLNRETTHLIAAIDNTLEAQRLTRTLFRSFDCNSNCYDNCEVVDLIIENIDRALENIDRFLINSEHIKLACNECAAFIDIEEAKAILRKLKYYICEIANNNYSCCTLYELEGLIRREDFIRVVVYLIRILKTIYD